MISHNKKNRAPSDLNKDACIPTACNTKAYE